MIESVISLLIYVLLIALAVYLVLWVLSIIGISLPPKVVQIVWAIAVLVILLMVLRVVLPQLGHGRLLGYMPSLIHYSLASV